MKKGKHAQKDELRSEYKLSDFPTPMVRGKYAKRLKESSNIIVLNPEVSAVFPNGEAVNSALLSLIKLAKTTTRPTRSSGRGKNIAPPNANVRSHKCMLSLTLDTNCVIALDEIRANPASHRASAARRAPFMRVAMHSADQHAALPGNMTGQP